MNKFILVAFTFSISHFLSISAESINSIDPPLPNQIEIATSQPSNQLVGFKYPVLTQEQIHQVCSQMYAQVQANEQIIKNYVMTIQDPNEKVEFMLDMELEISMQKHLISVIKDSPEIITPRVRQAFMHRLRQNFFPNFNPDRIATRSLATIYFLDRIIEAEMPYVSH